ncbi:MAG: PRC-barrel domain-containing protein [Eubacterium sp.]
MRSYGYKRKCTASGRGEYYLCDVIGATVYNEEDDSVIGEVKDVIETGANNVFAIGPGWQRGAVCR